MGMSIIKIRILAHAGKAWWITTNYFKMSSQNQNLLLLIDTQVWRLVIIEAWAGDHYFSPLLPSPLELMVWQNYSVGMQSNTRET